MCKNFFCSGDFTPFVSKTFQNPLGKLIWKKWSQIWKLLLLKGVKLPRKKKFFFSWEFCHTSRISKELAFWANSFYKSKCLYVCVFVCPSHFLTLFKGLFAPTYQSPMSKLFRFLESLGKNNRNIWSHIWKLTLIEAVKLLQERKKKSRIFVISSLRVNVFLSPLPEFKWTNF